jgi:hypothetical protein
VRRVEEVQHLNVFESLPQGVRAGGFLKDLKPWEISEGFEPSKESKEGERPSTLKVGRKA